MQNNIKLSQTGHARFMEALTSSSIDEICADAHISVADKLQAGDLSPGVLGLIFDSGFEVFRDNLMAIEGVSLIHITALYASLSRRAADFDTTASDGATTERENNRRRAKAGMRELEVASAPEALVVVQSEVQAQFGQISFSGAGELAGEASSPASLFLKGLLTWIGPDDFKNKDKLRKLLKMVRSGQQIQSEDNALAALSAALRSGSGYGEEEECDTRMPATKRSSTAARVRKSEAEAAKLFRNVRTLLSTNHFFKEERPLEPDFVTLDRWIKLTDYVSKLAYRHGWPLAAAYWVRFMDEHDYELLRPEESEHLTFTVLWPEMLNEVLEEFEPPPPPRAQREPREPREGAPSRQEASPHAALWAAFAGSCLVCRGKGHNGKVCDKRMNKDAPAACGVCGQDPCPHTSVVLCAAKKHGVKAKQA
jgi:hypothetical protein